MQLRFDLSTLLLFAAVRTSAVPSASTIKREDPNVALSARELLHDTSHFGVGVLSTTYASDFTDEGLRGLALSGPEYFAPCYDNGDLLFVALPVSQNWRNALFHDLSHNATFSIHPSSDPSEVDPRHSRSHGTKWEFRRPSWRKGMPSKQRITLFGSLERIPDSASSAASHCFTAQHKDAQHWIPGSDSPHTALWVRFRVERVYRVGGFGDESRIGWIERQLWREAKPEGLEFDLDAQKTLRSFKPVTTSWQRKSVELLFGDSKAVHPRPQGLLLQQ